MGEQENGISHTTGLVTIGISHKRKWGIEWDIPQRLHSGEWDIPWPLLVMRQAMGERENGISHRGTSNTAINGISHTAGFVTSGISLKGSIAGNGISHGLYQ